MADPQMERLANLVGGDPDYDHGYWVVENAVQAIEAALHLTSSDVLDGMSDDAWSLGQRVRAVLLPPPQDV